MTFKYMYIFSVNKDLYILAAIELIYFTVVPVDYGPFFSQSPHEKTLVICKCYQ